MTDLEVAVITGDLGWYVPPGAGWCPRCKDQNWDEATRLCITCTHGDVGYRDGAFRDGWHARSAPAAVLPVSTGEDAPPPGDGPDS